MLCITTRLVLIFMRDDNNTYVQVEDLYYHQFTQGVLWPLFHGIPTNFNEGLLDNFQGQYEVKHEQYTLCDILCQEDCINSQCFGVHHIDLHLPVLCGGLFSSSTLSVTEA